MSPDTVVCVETYDSLLSLPLFSRIVLLLLLCPCGPEGEVFLSFSSSVLYWFGPGTGSCFGGVPYTCGGSVQLFQIEGLYVCRGFL